MTDITPGSHVFHRVNGWIYRVIRNDGKIAILSNPLRHDHQFTQSRLGNLIPACNKYRVGDEVYSRTGPAFIYDINSSDGISIWYRCNLAGTRRLLECEILCRICQ